LSKEPDFNSAPKGKSESIPRLKQNSPSPRDKEAKTNIANIASVTPTVEAKQEKQSNFQPKIHIDVQIHISPESTADQIDQIFASMAKHLGNFNG